MQHAVRNTLSCLQALILASSVLAGCGQEAAPEVTTPTIPTNYEWATYNTAPDAPFLPKDIFSQELFVPGLICNGAETGYFERTDREDAGAYLLAGEYGKCYEVKIPQGASQVTAVTLRNKNPLEKQVGEKIYYTTEDALKDVNAPDKAVSFMFNCRKKNQMLLIYTGSNEPFEILERTIIQETDVQDLWWTPAEPVGTISADCTWGNVLWDSNTVIEKLYEPVRQRHPGYITREVIGKDQSGKYDIYSYIYTPENYEITIFLNAGTHGDEQEAYFAMAKVMELIADAKPEDNLLYTLRHKVRFVVVPILNVWSASESHIRYNSTGKDLNRDFDKLTQQESKNIIAYFEKYAKETCVMMDFHIAAKSKVAVYFNFINYTDNAVANYKTTNHMLHRYIDLGYAHFDTDLSKVPGSYTKGSQYLEGRIFNAFGVPSITIEYVTTADNLFPFGYSSEATTLAVETQMNFIIQNALFYLQNP